MNGEKRIIIAGVVLLVFGVSRAALHQQPLDKPLVGGIAFVLLLSLVSAFGPSLSYLAGNFALLAMVVVLLADGPQLLQAAGQVQTKGLGSPSGAPKAQKQ